MVLPTNGPNGSADLDLRDDVDARIAATPLPDRLPLTAHTAVRTFVADRDLRLPDVAEQAVTCLGLLAVMLGAVPTTTDTVGAMLSRQTVAALADLLAVRRHPAYAEGVRLALTALGELWDPTGWPQPSPADGDDVPYGFAYGLRPLYASFADLKWIVRLRAFPVTTLGVAVGATYDDLLVATTDDIVVSATGSVSVRLRCPERLVPALWAFHGPLRRIVETRPGRVLSGVGPMTRSVLDTLPADAKSEQAPALSFRRLRATWLAWHLCAGTPLPLLTQVGGPTLLDDVARVLPHLPAIPDTAARRWLTLGGDL